MSNPITIVSTKILNKDVKEQLGSNFRLLEYDFIQTIAAEEKDFAEAIGKSDPHWVFTSKQAVQYFLELMSKNKISIPSKPIIYCLAGETLNAVLNADLEVTTTADNALELAEKIYKMQLSKEVVFFCSSLRRPELPDYLLSNNIKVREVVIYKTLLQSTRVNSAYDAVLFFSPSAVQSFFMANKLVPEIVFFCIGNTTGSAVYDYAPGASVVVAKNPSQENLISLMRDYYENAFKK